MSEGPKVLNADTLLPRFVREFTDGNYHYLVLAKKWPAATECLMEGCKESPRYAVFDEEDEKPGGAPFCWEHVKPGSEFWKNCTVMDDPPRVSIAGWLTPLPHLFEEYAR